MRNCIICNSESKKVYFDSSVTVPVPYPLNGKQSIVQCERCGFIYSDSDNTEDNYHQYYLELNKHKKRANDAQYLDQVYFEKIFKKINNLNKDASILDFGSGDLLMRTILNEKGFSNIFTFDIESEVEYEDKFDLIISTHTFEHILDAEIVLAKLKKFLRSNGQLLIAVPDVSRYLEHYCGAYNWFDLEHINHFSSESLTNFVKSKGFTVNDRSSDKREVRPNLFYPEVIITCSKDEVERSKIQDTYEKDNVNLILEKYIKKSDSDLSKALTKYENIKEKRILVWGLGISAMRLVNHFENTNNIDFVDSDSRLWGRNLKGKNILSSDDLENISKYDFILITAVNYKAIKQYVRNKFGNDTEIIVL